MIGNRIFYVSTSKKALESEDWETFIDEAVELYYRAYSIPAYINERMGREIIPLNAWDEYYEPVTWVNDLVYDEFQEVCEFVHFVLDHYGEYEGVEEFAEQVSEELA